MAHQKEDLKILAIILAIIFPPLGVAITEGVGMALLVNVALTLFLFYFPGLFHALYVILRN